MRGEEGDGMDRRYGWLVYFVALRRIPMDGRFKLEGWDDAYLPGPISVLDLLFMKCHWIARGVEA